ncbi:MAG: DNA repair protein RecO [Defluviitaleaceae bacterium]|nr:DNA repair protein RecO [Defluviitaleaceae bacterium]MCL2239119.1 DNA repair protein RecO [Defluviitaleaceae bacterium]
MKTFKTRALVLREYEAGESDKRLLLLCKGVGRLSVYARGARKPKSKFIAAAQLFTYSDLVIAEGRGFHSLAQASVIENFYNLRTDYDALCCAHVITEICEKTILESENCDELLQLTLKALNHLHKTPTLPPLQTLAVFMLRFFAWYGVAPGLEKCCVCGREALFLCAEGLTCNSHPTTKIPISHPSLAALRHIFDKDAAQAFLFTATPAIIQEINNAAQLLWRHHFDWELRSAGFL